jgi:hypothetical protein
MQNGSNQNKARLFWVKHRMSLETEATKAGHDLVHGLPDAGNAASRSNVRSSPAWQASA